MIKSIGKSFFGMVALLFAGSLLSTAASAQAPISGYFTLHNYETGYCLAVQGGNPSPGTSLIVWPCDGTWSQEWRQGDPTADGSTGMQAYTLQSELMNCRDCRLVAGVQGGAVFDAASVIIWSEDPTNYGSTESGDNQGWAFSFYTTDGNGHACYQILNAGIERQNAYNLGVQNGSTAQNQQVVIWQDTDGVGDHPDQLWCIY